MNTVLAILLLVLKALGALVLFLLALVLLVSLLPFGARIDWRADLLTVDAVLGPVKKRFLTRTLGAKKTQKAAPPQSVGAAPRGGPQEKAAPPPETAPPETPPAPQSAPAPAAKAEKQTAAPAPQAAPPAAPGFADRLLAAARRDPVLFIQRVTAHALFAGGRLLRGVRVTGLWVYWPVHAAEAAQTALLHASLLAALNNALVRVQEQMTVRPEELWLEPDFTGELAPRRRIACTVTMRPIVLLVLAPRLLWRLWRDTAFAGVFPGTKPPQTLDQAS